MRGKGNVLYNKATPKHVQIERRHKEEKISFKRSRELLQEIVEFRIEYPVLTAAEVLQVLDTGQEKAKQKEKEGIKPLLQVLQDKAEYKDHQKEIERSSFYLKDILEKQFTSEYLEKGVVNEKMESLEKMIDILREKKVKDLLSYLKVL